MRFSPRKQISLQSLLYGFSQPSSIYYYYRHYSFYYRADENGVKLPRIHLILCKTSNVNKQNENDKYWRSIYEIYTKHREIFDESTNEHSREIENFQDFLLQYVMNIEHETNIVSRLAVKSHSPLLAVKHSHSKPNDYQSTVQTFDQTLNEIVERI